MSADWPCSQISWGRWSADVLATGLTGLAEALGPDLPVFTTYSPPARADRVPGRAAGRYDAWLVRNRVGAATARLHQLDGQRALGRGGAGQLRPGGERRTGPNIEENWGLRWAEANCAFAVVPIHHTLLGVACGATGISVYPACATAGWGRHLMVDHALRTDPSGDPRRSIRRTGTPPRSGSTRAPARPSPRCRC
ncbi:hypothetical protein ACFQ0M_01855 [Kitasatospora aburaviensis]